jgi:hypothetical protein
VFDTSAAVDVAMVFVWTDMRFVRCRGAMDPTVEWVIGVPIPSVAAVTDSDALKGLLAVRWRKGPGSGLHQSDERGFPFWRLYNWSIGAGPRGRTGTG